jgi:hypothetical protein
MYKHPRRKSLGYFTGRPEHEAVFQLIRIAAGPIPAWKLAGPNPGGVRRQRDGERTREPDADAGRRHGKAVEHLGDLVPCGQLRLHDRTKRGRELRDLCEHIIG